LTFFLPLISSLRWSDPVLSGFASSIPQKAPDGKSRAPTITEQEHRQGDGECSAQIQPIDPVPRLKRGEKRITDAVDYILQVPLRAMWMYGNDLRPVHTCRCKGRQSWSSFAVLFRPSVFRRDSGGTSRHPFNLRSGAHRCYRAVFRFPCAAIRILEPPDSKKAPSLCTSLPSTRRTWMSLRSTSLFTTDIGTCRVAPSPVASAR